MPLNYIKQHNDSGFFSHNHFLLAMGPSGSRRIPFVSSEPAIPVTGTRADLVHQANPLQIRVSPPPCSEKANSNPMMRDLEKGLPFTEPLRMPNRAYIPATLSMHSAGVQFPSVYAESERSSSTVPMLFESPPKRRNFFTRMIMAPFDLLELLLKRWLRPSDDCLRCVRVTYWIVLIVGGIITTVIALLPFL